MFKSEVQIKFEVRRDSPHEEKETNRIGAHFIDQLFEYPDIERLNIGPVSTMQISWDQPHEGNMFEFLYKRRSIERAW